MLAGEGPSLPGALPTKGESAQTAIPHPRTDRPSGFPLCHVSSPIRREAGPEGRLVQGEDGKITQEAIDLRGRDGKTSRREGVDSGRTGIRHRFWNFRRDTLWERQRGAEQGGKKLPSSNQTHGPVPRGRA